MTTFLQAAEAVAVSEETRMGLWTLFTKGGWLMWPLLALGGVTIFIFVERFMAIRKASVLDMNFMNRIRDYISDGKISTAVNLCKKTDTPIARMIEKGIERIGRPMSDVQTAIENVANLEVSKLENGLPFLATIAGGAPMIGFLGTVLGMVQTFMDMTENNLKEVQFERGNLLEFVLSPDNLNRAYLQVKRNHGSCGVDGLSTEELGGYLKEHKDELMESLKSGRYRPNPVLRVEIPKDNGRKRPLGIPTVVDRVIQQAVSQILSPIYERQFSDNSFGFRPHRSCHKALKRAQEYITQGYKYCVCLDLERFFDTVNHSMLIRILSRTIRDGRVISLIHKYLTAGVMVKRGYEESVEGVPQGGPLSPLLANIMLNELDKELALTSSSAMQTTA